MPTSYTDALYSVTNLGVVTNSFFGLSAASNEVALISAGTLNGVNVVGIAYNAADWEAATALGARLTVTLNPRINGVAPVEAPTTLTVGVSAADDLTFAVLLADRRAVEVTYIGGIATYNFDLSSTNTFISDKNQRRLFTLGLI
jgi:hypothetical protein